MMIMIKNLVSEIRERETRKRTDLFDQVRVCEGKFSFLLSHHFVLKILMCYRSSYFLLMASPEAAGFHLIAVVQEHLKA